MNKLIFNDYLKLLPEQMHSQILKFVRWQDSQASLLGKLLLYRILRQYQGVYSLNDVRTTVFGRPYIEGAFDFNISHSGSFVVCAFTDQGKIGVDIEQKLEIEIKNFKGIFNDGELESLLACDDKYNQFYSLWTIKEAAIKADGRGFHIPLKEIRTFKGKVFLQDQIWFQKSILIDPGYSLDIVTERPVMDLAMEEIHFTS